MLSFLMIKEQIFLITVEILKEMKLKHTAKFLKPQILRKHISALNIVINYIGNKIIDNSVNEYSNAPNIQDKISYNNVNVYKSIIEEYALYNSHLNKLYKEIEEQGSTKKEIILQNIRTLYLKEKARKSIEEIRNNADGIIENIKNKLWENIEHNENSFELSIEVIEISLLVILVDAFMRCKILEEPKT
jgi:glutamine synthetase type III